MTTILFFQNLAWIATDLARMDILLPWPKAQWRLANNITVPAHISSKRWNEGYDSFYGYDRKETA